MVVDGILEILAELVKLGLKLRLTICQNLLDRLNLRAADLSDVFSPVLPLSAVAELADNTGFDLLFHRNGVRVG